MVTSESNMIWDLVDSMWLSRVWAQYVSRAASNLAGFWIMPWSMLVTNGLYGITGYILG